jgi:hypothetical protein
MTPFAPLIDTDAALRAHARMPTGRQYVETLTPDERREQQASQRITEHHAARKARAASLGLTVTAMKRMGGYRAAMRALGRIE